MDVWLCEDPIAERAAGCNSVRFQVLAPWSPLHSELSLVDRGHARPALPKGEGAPLRVLCRLGRTCRVVSNAGPSAVTGSLVFYRQPCLAAYAGTVFSGREVFLVLFFFLRPPAVSPQPQSMTPYPLSVDLQRVWPVPRWMPETGRPGPPESSVPHVLSSCRRFE